MTRIPFSSRLSTLLLAAAILSGSSAARAQECGMTFGPPLRQNMLFAYKYTERVRAVYETPGENGPIRDSSERTLTYFITERQLPFIGDQGLVKIEVNIDSMQMEYHSGDESLTFDTQKQATEYKDITHRELLVPSALVNRVAIFTLSPYGELVKIEGPILDIRNQVNAPQIDEFTRDRGMALTAQEYLVSVMFPWRGAAPLGRSVVCGRPLEIKTGLVLDRVPFADPVEATFTMSGENRHLNYQGTLAHPAVRTMTVNSFRDPLTITSASGTISGGLELDQDGVVREGWSAARGTLVGTVDNLKVNGTISHEVFISRMWISPFTVNAAP
jgi:hypothetical protein